MFKVLPLEPHEFVCNNDIFSGIVLYEIFKSAGGIEQFASNKDGCRHVTRLEGTHFW